MDEWISEEEKKYQKKIELIPFNWYTWWCYWWLWLVRINTHTHTNREKEKRSTTFIMEKNRIVCDDMITIIRITSCTTTTTTTIKANTKYIHYWT